jgi:2-polyprenyl-6-methoxyphenol hydroxylase-like FAD-dependent oxidoreductase
MKAVIIGGGIAGLAAAISLKRTGMDVVIKEKAPAFREVGLGFIILPNGLQALDQLGAGDYVRTRGRTMHQAIIRTPGGLIEKQEDLGECLAIKRAACIDALRVQVPAHLLQTGFEFSHFLYNREGQATAIVSTQGEVEYGDLFLGADGANSLIRKKLFPLHETRQSPIRELVGIVDMPQLARQLDGNLLKTQCRHQPLSFGLLACNERQVLWYMQFDSTLFHLDDLSPENKKAFTASVLQGWPHPIPEVLQVTDYNKTFLWLTKDMELLHSFHRQNMVLLGDAAHLTLPFTSQGTNSALTDALTLGRLLAQYGSSTEAVFQAYYQARIPALQEYLSFGRRLENRFLHPELYMDEDALIPLAK